MNDLLENWQALLHYFYIHCVLMRVSANSKSWAQFITSSHQRSFISQTTLQHIVYANSISAFLKLPAPGSFADQEAKLVFLGTGKWEGPIAKCLLVEALEPSHVYQKKDIEVILTTDARVLSHGFLAAAETQTKVVGNIDPRTWTSLKTSSNVKIDFSGSKLLL